jgi:hypothetical protein
MIKTPGRAAPTGRIAATLGEEQGQKVDSFYFQPDLDLIWCLKGQCHEMDIFLKVEQTSALSVYALMFSISFKSFSLPYTINNFLFESLKILTNCENAY